MSRQGCGRAPISAGISGLVVAVALAAWAANKTLQLSNTPRTLGGPFGLIDRGGTFNRPSTATPRHLAPDVLYARSAPAVVRVNVHGPGMKAMGHGTGFFVSPDGLVITNFHVIDGARHVTIERADGTVLRVEGVVALDEHGDLVLVKVAPAGAPLPTLPLGHDPPPPVGTKVYAIGHPHGLKNVLSEGLVSGLGDASRGHHFIQTTAAISPGSSGGPLMTADGVVVGVTTATVRGAQSLNFAMPAERVRALLACPRAARPRTVAELTTAHRPSRRRPSDLPGQTQSSLERALDGVWDALRREDLGEAARLLDGLKGLGRDDAYYWFTAGCLHVKLHNDDLAVEAFTTSLELRPDKVATYLNLGQVYVRRGSLKDAIATYDAAAKIDPNDSRAYAQAGEAYLRFGQTLAAVPFLKRATNLDPHNADHHRNLGIALLDLNRPSEALKSLRRAVALCPDAAEAYLFLGNAHHALRNHQAAMDAWRNADRLDGATGKSGQFARRAMSRNAPAPELKAARHR